MLLCVQSYISLRATGVLSCRTVYDSSIELSYTTDSQMFWPESASHMISVAGQKRTALHWHLHRPKLFKPPHRQRQAMLYSQQSRGLCWVSAGVPTQLSHNEGVCKTICRTCTVGSSSVPTGPVACSSGLCIASHRPLPKHVQAVHVWSDCSGTPVFDHDDNSADCQPLESHRSWELPHICIRAFADTDSVQQEQNISG